MIRKKIYFAGIVSVLLILALTVHSFVRKPVDAKDEKAEEPVVPVYNPVVEIQSTLNQFDSILSENLKQSGTVGAAAVITYKGRIALLRCYGVRKVGTKDPVNENTVFRLASVSKSITGVLAGILDDENIVKLDDKVADYVPALSLKDPVCTKELTVRHLLSHTSGLIPHAFDLMVEDHVPLDKIIERLPEVPMTASPGKMYGYQNVMYSLYDPVASAKTKQSFDHLIREKVFVPFQMKDASTGFEAFEENENKAYPHQNTGNHNFKAMKLNDRYYSTAPAAGVNASISDLGQLLANLTDPESKVISKKIRETIFAPQVVSPLTRGYFHSWGKGVQSKQYSIGWRIVDYKGRKIAYHGGFVSGYKAEMAYCEEEEIGIALLTNSPTSESAQNIPDFLNMIFAEKERIALENSAAKNNDDKS
ncbi:serine hydrolase domain-containing protein [Maribellus sp. YY47]|uniref:serine hydrolase domain-containing protein n=1 Tax=Maribellus sp. YY47 TaxID=2929486 RepID=UPI00200193F4|nr:serine hydrolase domain-containing protein [Maribellus sp. YY47]MCK3685449.1 beta-lactamase family protein [Maribellus sp. YY47]